MGALGLSGEISVPASEETSSAELARDIPEELPVDTSWEDVYDSGGLGSAGAETDNRLFEIQDSPAESLRDHLTWQMGLTSFSDTDLAIATAIIDSIDDDGYLTLGLDEIRQGFTKPELEPEEVEAVLHRIQNFDPPGVAARDLRECLLIQLQQLPLDTRRLAEARRLVDEHLPLLGNRDYAQLMRRLKLDEPGLQEVIDLIRQYLSQRAAAGGPLVLKKPAESPRNPAQGRLVHCRAPARLSRARRRGDEGPGAA